jgi:hypothetical protein
MPSTLTENPVTSVPAASSERALAHFDALLEFETDCADCNGADRAAIRLARLGRPVKKMIGRVTGWLDEGYDLVS